MWRFQLCESGTPQALTPVTTPPVLIGELFEAREKSLELILNRPGSVRFSLNLRDDLAPSIKEGTTCILAWRETISGVWECRWSGPVWSVEEDIANRVMNVTAVGWFEEVNKRLIRANVEPQYNNLDAGQIAMNLLAFANEQGKATHVGAGTYDLSATRTVKFQRFSSYGQSIQSLSDVENGFDFLVDPLTRQLNIYFDPITGSLNGRGTNRPNAIFTMGWGTNNLSALNVATEMSSVANRYTTIGRNNVMGMAEDTESQAIYGIHEDSGQIDGNNGSIVLAYSGAEVAVRAFPRPIYSLTPFPWTKDSAVPRLFDDYDVGDVVYLSAKGGRNAIGTTLPGQALRVFGVQISIDNEGRELITSIQTSPPS